MEISALTPASPPPGRAASLRKAATELEATFLAEMLRAGGLGETSKSFGGGAGEDQFSSFLVMEQARKLAQAGGVGLAEILFNSLMERTHGK